TPINVVVGDRESNPSETNLFGWRFTSSDGRWVVSIAPDHFALETSAYLNWPDFAARFGELVDAVTTHVAPALELRIGLRYIDRIRELELPTLTAWAPYLRPEMLGLALHPQLGEAVRAAQQQVVLAITEDVVCGIRHGPVANAEEGRVDYVLDFDVF